MSGGSVPKSFACATAVTILAGCLALGIIQGLVHGAGYTDANSNLRGGAGVPENQPASAAVAVSLVCMCVVCHKQNDQDMFFLQVFLPFAFTCCCFFVRSACSRSLSGIVLFRAVHSAV